MKLFFNCIAMLALLVGAQACTKENKETAKKMEPQKPSIERCMSECEIVQEQCRHLASTVAGCEKESSDQACSKWSESFFGLFKVNLSQDKVCNEACGDFFRENPFKVCESKKSESTAELGSRVMDLIISSDETMIKSLQVSEKINKMGYQKFNKNLLVIKEEHSPKKLKGLLVTEELNHHLREILFQVVLHKDQLACLSKDTQAKLEKLKNKTKVGEAKFNVAGLEEQIFADCKLNNLQYMHEDRLVPFPKNLESISYVQFRPKNDDCYFEIPRIELNYKTKSNANLILPAGFKQLTDQKTLDLMEEFNKNNYFYNLSVHVFKWAFAFNGKTYFVAMPPSMATSYEFFELTPFGPMSAGSAYNQPCGS